MRIFSVAVATATLAFSVSVNAASTLYGVTGDGASTPETLFTISTTDASSSFFMALGNGDDGESIGYNPNTGFMNHASGLGVGTEVWEEISLSGPALHSTQPRSGANAGFDEVLDLAFNTATGEMMGTGFGTLYSFTPAGVATLIGLIDTDDGTPKGLAFNGGVLFGADRNGSVLLSISALDGTTILSTAMTLGGNPINGVNGLTTNPDDGSLWGIVKQGGGARHLATIDTITGVVTSVGFLDDNFAGIEFVPQVPIPAAAWLFGSAVLGLVGVARRKKAQR